MTNESASTGNNESENVIADYYDNYQDTQKELLAIEMRRIRNALLTIAIIAFLSEFLGLLRLNSVDFMSILAISIIPALILGLAFLAPIQPMPAVIIAAVIVIGTWVWVIAMIGAQGMLMGWLVKAIIIYFLIAAFQHAREATRIRKELKNS